VRFEFEIDHRPERDGSHVTSRHVPFFLAHEATSFAWRSALAAAGPAGVELSKFGVVSVRSDFWHEVFVGTATFDVTVTRVGTSSVGLRVEIGQFDKPVAQIDSVIARVDESRLHSVALTDEERSGLESLLDPPAA
jgi:acyl-CoA thioesterase FadM